MAGLPSLIAFAETARRGSFAAAAREMGSAPSTLAKAVARLEADLGVKLFHRTTRQVRLTADGERLARRCERVLAEWEDLRTEAAGTRAAPSGLLRVDLPLVYGRQVVMPVLAGLASRHPDLRLDVRLHDTYTDLIQHGIDLAVRVGELGDSRLVARRIDRQAMLLVASPEHLQRHGTPRTLAQLQRQPAVVHRLPSSGRLRPWVLSSRGRRVEMEPASRWQIDDGDGVVQAACLGLGLAQLPDYMVAEPLARGRLVEVLPSFRPTPQPISVVVPSGRLMPPRVRVALDALVAMGRERSSA